MKSARSTLIISLVTLLLTTTGCGSLALRTSIQENGSIANEFKSNLDGFIVAKAKIVGSNQYQISGALTEGRDLTIALQNSQGERQATLASTKPPTIEAASDVKPVLIGFTELFRVAEIPDFILKEGEAAVVLTRGPIFIGDALDFGARKELVGKEILVVSNLQTSDARIHMFRGQDSVSRADKRAIRQIADSSFKLVDGVSWVQRSPSRNLLLAMGFLVTVPFDVVTFPIQFLFALSKICHNCG